MSPEKEIIIIKLGLILTREGSLYEILNQGIAHFLRCCVLELRFYAWRDAKLIEPKKSR
jgi:hypothetical protein